MRSSSNERSRIEQNTRTEVAKFRYKLIDLSLRIGKLAISYPLRAERSDDTHSRSHQAVVHFQSLI